MSLLQTIFISSNFQLKHVFKIFQYVLSKKMFFSSRNWKYLLNIILKLFEIETEKTFHIIPISWMLKVSSEH